MPAGDQERTEISAGELQLLALAAVNDELERLISRLGAEAARRLEASGLSLRDRLQLKLAELENDCHERGIRIV
jgi:hypothetical protein